MDSPDEPVLEPAAALSRIAFLLERVQSPTYRVKAYRTAARTVAALPPDEVSQRVAAGTIKDVKGIGPKTAAVISQAAAGKVPDYLAELEDQRKPLAPGGEAIRAALKGDLHSHSDWSDGGSPIEEMYVAAMDIGHEYIALTDHSPHLTVARGLTAERLYKQIKLVKALNKAVDDTAPVLLTGIECDINEDGTLDQTDDLLGQLDIVVGSVHSALRSPAAVMTKRMLTAIDKPYIDVLGHCTGRIVAAGPDRSRPSSRPESTFDAGAVFAACAERGVAVEINCRPERLDPPKRLLAQAIETGCLFSIDTDAHAPGQLDWQEYGCARAVECGVPVDRIVNTWPLAKLLEWTRRPRT